MQQASFCTLWSLFLSSTLAHRKYLNCWISLLSVLAESVPFSCWPIKTDYIVAGFTCKTRYFSSYLRSLKISCVFLFNLQLVLHFPPLPLQETSQWQNSFFLAAVHPHLAEEFHLFYLSLLSLALYSMGHLHCFLVLSSRHVLIGLDYNVKMVSIQISHFCLSSDFSGRLNDTYSLRVMLGTMTVENWLDHKSLTISDCRWLKFGLPLLCEPQRFSLLASVVVLAGNYLLEGCAFNGLWIRCIIIFSIIVYSDYFF